MTTNEVRPSLLHDDDPVRWPEGAAEILEMPPPTLKARREMGDAPQLYAIGRAIFTTRRALREWVQSHAVDPGFRARPSTHRKA